MSYNDLSGTELKKLIEELRELANKHLGLTNYVHLNDCINIADDGTFTIVLNKGSNEKPACVSRSIIRAENNIEHVDYWEKELFWGWDKKWMTLRVVAHCVTEDGDGKEVLLTIDDKIENMDKWKGKYLENSDNRGTIIKDENNNTEDILFGNPKEDKSELDSEGESNVDSYVGDEVSQYLTSSYKIWFNGAEYDRPLKTFFKNPEKERAYDVNQSVETKRIRSHAVEMTNILNEIIKEQKHESVLLRNESEKLQRLQSAYNCLDNEIRPVKSATMGREFNEMWERFTQLLRSLFNRMKQL